LRKAHVHDEAHRAWLDDFYAGGLLLMAGPFANPADGYMSVFTSREAAEEFIQGDPSLPMASSPAGLFATGTKRYRCSFSASGFLLFDWPRKLI